MTDRGRSGSAAPVVSLIIVTYDRFERLRRTVARVERNVTTPHEIIVVGGATDDGTAEWAEAHPRIRFLRETQREGAVRASNRGFRAARGEYVCCLNDDAYPLPGAVEAAVEMIERPDLSDVGIVGFYHNSRAAFNVLDTVEREGVEYKMYNVRGYAYANFGLIRLSLMREIGYYDERYYTYGTDPDVAMRLQREKGLKVIGCRAALLHHDEIHDRRKLDDLDTVFQRDNAKFLERWDLPEKNSYADPGPAYRAMLAERGLLYEDLKGIHGPV